MIALQIADPSSRQRRRPIETRPQISDGNIPAGSNILFSSVLPGKFRGRNSIKPDQIFQLLSNSTFINHHTVSMLYSVDTYIIDKPQHINIPFDLVAKSRKACWRQKGQHRCRRYYYYHHDDYYYYYYYYHQYFITTNTTTNTTTTSTTTTSILLLLIALPPILLLLLQPVLLLLFNNNNSSLSYLCAKSERK
jgi:hypothetical protein